MTRKDLLPYIWSVPAPPFFSILNIQEAPKESDQLTINATLNIYVHLLFPWLLSKKITDRAFHQSASIFVLPSLDFFFLHKSCAPRNQRRKMIVSVFSTHLTPPILCKKKDKKNPRSTLNCLKWRPYYNVQWTHCAPNRRCWQRQTMLVDEIYF